MSCTSVPSKNISRLLSDLLFSSSLSKAAFSPRPRDSIESHCATYVWLWAGLHFGDVVAILEGLVDGDLDLIPALVRPCLAMRALTVPTSGPTVDPPSSCDLARGKYLVLLGRTIWRKQKTLAENVVCHISKQ